MGKFDVVDRMEKYIQSPRFVDLDRNAVHQRFLGLLQGSEPFRDYMIDHLRDRILNYLGATAQSDEQYLQEKEAFLNNVWPEVSFQLKEHPALAQFVLEFGLHSRYLCTFLQDVWHNQAIAVLLGHGIGRSVLGKLEVIPEYDSIYPFCATDNSFLMIRNRGKEINEILRPAQYPLVLGGVDPAIWTRGYPLGQIGQHMRIIDLNPTMPDYLRQLVGDDLTSLGIDYRIMDFFDIVNHPELEWEADAIGIGGLASYYGHDIERLKQFFAAVSYAIMPGAMGAADFQIFHPVLQFDVGVLLWPREMHCYKDIDDACENAEIAMNAAGLKIIGTSTEPYDPDKGETPAGVTIKFMKPEVA